MPASSLAYQTFGPNTGPTIVFLHGGGVGWWMWLPVIQQLSDFHCLAPDQPEHGGSRSIAPFSMALAAEKTAELIRQQAHGGKACVVGLSEGAQITVQLLATAPELVEKALVSSALLQPIPGLSWANSRPLLTWSFRLFVTPFKNVDWWARLNMKYAAGVPAEFYPYFKKDFAEMGEAEYVNLMLANQAFRLPAGLEKAAAPTLVVAGHKEYPAMQQSARDLVAALPTARGALLNLGPKATLAQEHNWALTAPQLFARTLRAWIEEKPLPPELLPSLSPGSIAQG
jgi:pimeloyl-ACP methyl ester carboxylesterase